MKQQALEQQVKALQAEIEKQNDIMRAHGIGQHLDKRGATKILIMMDGGFIHAIACDADIQIGIIDYDALEVNGNIFCGIGKPDYVVQNLWDNPFLELLNDQDCTTKAVDELKKLDF